MSLRNPDHRTRTLFELSWTDGLEVLLTDNNAPLTTLEGRSYYPVPRMAIELEPDTLELGEDLCTVTFPLDEEAPSLLQFFGLALSGSPLTNIDVKIREVELDTGNIIGLRQGVLARVLDNFRDRQGVVGLEIVSVKSLLDRPAGIPCNPHCAWNYGGAGCGRVPDWAITTLSIFPNSRIIQVADAISSNSVNIGSQIPRFWEQGYIQRDGMRIKIKSWTFQTLVFQLVFTPPASWDNTQITIVGGCYGTPQACEERGNQTRFGGIGHDMPAWNPLVHSGTEETS